MSTITRTLAVNASHAHTWNIIKDFGGVHRWHPSVETSPLLSSNNEGLGAKRVCNFYDGTHVAEEVVEYRDGEFLSIELSDFSMPLKRAHANIHVRKLGAQKTEVEFSMDYDVKYGPMGWVMDKAMIQPMMGKLFAQVLKGLGHHVETGDLIGKGGEIVPVAAAA